MLEAGIRTQHQTVISCENTDLDFGISINGEKIAVLLYADDVVLLSESEHDLQCVLDALNEWCNQNQLYVNENKSNVVHFRCKSNPLTEKSFNIGAKVIQVANQYVYLGSFRTSVDRTS